MYKRLIIVPDVRDVLGGNRVRNRERAFKNHASTAEDYLAVLVMRSNHFWIRRSHHAPVQPGHMIVRLPGGFGVRQHALTEYLPDDRP